MIKILRNIWSKFDQEWPNWQNLYPKPETSGQMLKLILRELFTLFPMVYISLYFYVQIFSKLWSKWAKNWSVWPKLFQNLHIWDLILKRILRELWTLFPTVYISLYFYVQIFEISFVKIGYFLDCLAIRC